ncbi:unnamed protein product [Cuscuta europaea]|uniref:Uncharacterized protein n=1 Tax=Cuscuta europaea TaxID=41803 RepID=A0A9P0ZRY7_CUSEU|nr:unnamed protein product [Cuscuta europaea]
MAEIWSNLARGGARGRFRLMSGLRR